MNMSQFFSKVKLVHYNDLHLHSFQVLVEYDDLHWDKREWVSIYKEDNFALFLLEENLVLAHRSSAPYAQPHSGTLHPAMVKN